MGSHSTFGKKDKKKQKQTGAQGGGQSFSSKPVFVLPQVYKKEKKGE